VMQLCHEAPAGSSSSSRCKPLRYRWINWCWCSCSSRGGSCDRTC
jgi:hypothetical protein